MACILLSSLASVIRLTDNSCRKCDNSVDREVAATPGDRQALIRKAPAKKRPKKGWPKKRGIKMAMTGLDAVVQLIQTTMLLGAIGLLFDVRARLRRLEEKLGR